LFACSSCVHLGAVCRGGLACKCSVHKTRVCGRCWLGLLFGGMSASRWEVRGRQAAAGAQRAVRGMTDRQRLVDRRLPEGKRAVAVPATGSAGLDFLATVHVMAARMCRGCPDATG